MHTTISYNGSWEGLLTVVFEFFDRKLEHVKIVNSEHYQPDVFSDYLPLATDAARAQRVLTGLKKKLSPEAVKKLFRCYLSEQPGIENHILDYIRLTFSSPSSIESAYGYPAVLKISQVDKMIGRECHRMEAFVRFQLTRDDIYFAAVVPDFNVLPLIVSHFKKRYADQPWIIYDLKRKYGIYYDLSHVEEIELENLPDLSSANTKQLMSGNEIQYQQLWKTYFDSVNIKERKNSRLHVQHVPKRYWRYLPEKFLL